jgi:hypothetical protein
MHKANLVSSAVINLAMKYIRQEAIQTKTLSESKLGLRREYDRLGKAVCSVC